MSGRKQIYVVLLTGVFCTGALGQELGSYSFVPLSGSPHDVVYDTSRNLAYVTNRSLNRIDVVSMADLSVATSIPVSSSPRGLAITPDSSRLVVTLYNSEQMSFVDLNSQTETQVIDLPPGRDRNYPLRVDFDAAGTCIWRDGGPGNPYGYVYSLDLQSGVSTRLVPLENDLRYTGSFDGSKFLFMFDGDEAGVWDAGSQTSSTPVTIPGFGHGWTDWITQGTINNAGDTILLTREGSETLVYDGSYNYQGTTMGMAWGTFGPWDDLALIVEAYGDESPKNIISILDSDAVSIIDSLTLPQTVGIGEYNFGSQPIFLTPDAQQLLAVGQTGLYVIDTSDIPEPCTLTLMVLGGIGVLRRRRGGRSG